MMPRGRFVSCSSPVRQAQRGVALLEALIAVLLLGIALVGTLALQVNSQAALSEAAMRAEATIAANELIGVMSTDLDHLDDYVLAKDAEPGERLETWHAALVEHLPNAAVVITVTPAADTERTAVVIVIDWRRSDEAQQNTHRIVTYLARSA
jgi:type IV pilus assembly protein PilV